MSDNQPTRKALPERETAPERKPPRPSVAPVMDARHEHGRRRAWVQPSLRGPDADPCVSAANRSALMSAARATPHRDHVMNLPRPRRKHNRCRNAAAAPVGTSNGARAGASGHRAAPFARREGSRPLTEVTLQEGPRPPPLPRALSQFCPGERKKGRLKRTESLALTVIGRPGFASTSLATPTMWLPL